MDNKTIRYSVLICVVLVLATAGVYQQVRSYDFIGFDDPYYISENEHIQDGLTGEGLVWAFTTGRASNWHPLTWLSHMSDWQLYGDDAGKHHLTNVLLHLVNTVLLFIVLKQMTGGLWQSAFVAAAFALHPLHVESVAWISERKDVLSTLFWMLTMWAYLGYVRRRALWRYLLVALCLALGLMAKPMVVTLPFVLLLLDFWPLGRFQEQGSGSRASTGFSRARAKQLVWEKVPLFVLSSLSGIVTFLVQRSGGAVVNTETISLGIRLANSFVSYMAYIGKMVWPVRLAIMYPHVGDKLSMGRAGLAVLLLVVISVVVVRLGKRYRYLPVGWLWFLGTLVPVIGLIQVGQQGMADRYTYIPLTGLFIIIAWSAADIFKRWRYREVVLGCLGGVVILGLSICTSFNVRHWRNTITLFEHAIGAVEGNNLAHATLGYYYSKHGRDLEAIEHYISALKLEPQDLASQNNLGMALARQGMFDDAIVHFKNALMIKPDAGIYYKLGMAYFEQGKLADAMSHYRKALEMDPDDADTHNSLGIVLGQQGRLDEAIGHFSEALRIRPDFVEAHSNFGYAFARQDKFDEAVVHFKEVVRLSPESVLAHQEFAHALSEDGRVGEAVRHLRDTLGLNPDWTDLMNMLSWFLATSADAEIRNADEAISFAERACELTNYDNPSFLDTLAAAYASGGRFDDAVSTARKALALMESSDDKKLAEKITKRLRLYEAGKGYIESSGQ